MVGWSPVLNDEVVSGQANGGREHTSRVGKHAHQRSELRWAPSMGDVQPASSGTGNTASRWLQGLLCLRLLLRLRLRLWLLRLLLLLHGGQSGRCRTWARRVLDGTKAQLACVDRRVAWQWAEEQVWS